MKYLYYLSYSVIAGCLGGALLYRLLDGKSIVLDSAMLGLPVFAGCVIGIGLRSYWGWLAKEEK